MKLTSVVKENLIEALRRRLAFASKNEALKDQWVGLGFENRYKTTINGRYMKWTHGQPYKGTMGWLQLTDKGCKIIEKWIANGVTLEDFNYFDFKKGSLIKLEL